MPSACQQQQQYNETVLCSSEDLLWCMTRVPVLGFSAEALALGSNCDHVADLNIRTQPLQLVQPDHLLR